MRNRKWNFSHQTFPENTTVSHFDCLFGFKFLPFCFIRSSHADTTLLLSLELFSFTWLYSIFFIAIVNVFRARSCSTLFLLRSSSSDSAIYTETLSLHIHRTRRIFVLAFFETSIICAFCMILQCSVVVMRLIPAPAQVLIPW